MAETLKEIDEDILERIKQIHGLAAQWNHISKAEKEAGKIDNAHFDKISRIWAKIEIEIIKIYNDVMTEEEIDDHLAKLHKEMGVDIGYKKQKHL